jgi:hypothetical protein
MRFLSALKQASRQWQITTLADGTIACWHPEKAFPYEHSRSIDPKELAQDRQVGFSIYHYFNVDLNMFSGIERIART